MRCKTTFSCLLALVFCGSLSAQVIAPGGVAPTPVPYRIVDSVSIMVTPTPTAKLNIWLDVHVPGSGAYELWSIETDINRSTNETTSSLDINGTLIYSVEHLLYYGLADIAIQTDDNYVVVDSSTFATDPDYAGILADTDNERTFVQDVVNELALLRSVQGVTPTYIQPSSSGGGGGSASTDGDTGGVDPVAVEEEDCREYAEDLYGPKPEDCEGAWDEYVCCVWEYAVDGAEAACECDKLPWWRQALCYAGETILSGIDGTACVLALPIPGG